MEFIFSCSVWSATTGYTNHGRSNWALKDKFHISTCLCIIFYILMFLATALHHTLVHSYFFFFQSTSFTFFFQIHSILPPQHFTFWYQSNWRMIGDSNYFPVFPSGNFRVAECYAHLWESLCTTMLVLR